MSAASKRVLGVTDCDCADCECADKRALAAEVEEREERLDRAERGRGNLLETLGATRQERDEWRRKYEELCCSYAEVDAERSRAWSECHAARAKVEALTEQVHALARAAQTDRVFADVVKDPCSGRVRYDAPPVPPPPVTSIECSIALTPDEIADDEEVTP